MRDGKNDDDKSIVFKQFKSESDCITGINDSGIETYKNSRFASLLKEELQNSTDAHDSENAANDPVIVTVNLGEIDAKDIPDYEKYCAMFHDELEYWSKLQKNDTKPEKFFTHAIEVLNKQKIPMLHISDRNTTGLLGIDEAGTPWDNIVKNDGVSDKGLSAGGSFGIGKNAAFACSDLRTVFYSTYTIKEEKGFQGSVKLSSYQKDGDNYSGKSFFCKRSNVPSECKAVREEADWPRFTNESNCGYGMDKYILGFNGPKDKEELKKELIPAALDSFLYAIYKGTLIVIIEGVTLSQDTLKDRLIEYKDDLDPTTKQYYAVLEKPDIENHLTLLEDDDVVLSVKLDPTFSKKAATIRQSGMLVFNRGHIGGGTNFAAIIYLKNDKVNNYFRKIENSEHSKWAYERADDPKKAKEYSLKIRSKLKEMIDTVREDHYGDGIDAEGMAEFLPGIFISDGPNRHEALSAEVKKITLSISKPLVSEDDVVRSFSESPGSNGKNRRDKKKRKKLSKDHYLSKHPNAYELSDDGSEYSLRYAKGRLQFINNSQDLKNVCLELFIACESNNGPKKEKIAANVKSATVNGIPVKHEANHIYLGDVKRGESVLVNFTTEWEGDLSLEVIAYAE